MDILEYYIPLIQLCKQKNMSIDIIRKIFNEYLKSSIIDNIQYKVINQLINTKYNNILYNLINNKRIPNYEYLSIHLCDIPYSCENIKKYRVIVDTIIKIKNYELYFSHYCCNNKGMMYKSNDLSSQNRHFLLM